VPGLINAYKTSATLVLQVVPITQKAITKQFSLQFDYTQMNDIMLVLKQLQVEILKQESQLFCQMTIAVAKNKEAELIYRLNNLRNVEVVKIV
jgi:putative IMPACT (imprinted ancient) family translation regulator